MRATWSVMPCGNALPMSHSWTELEDGSSRPILRKSFRCAIETSCQPWKLLGCGHQSGRPPQLPRATTSQLPTAVPDLGLAEEQALLTQEQHKIRSVAQVGAYVPGDLLVDPRFRIGRHVQVFDRPALNVDDVGVVGGVDEIRPEALRQSIPAPVVQVDRTLGEISGIERCR